YTVLRQHLHIHTPVRGLNRTGECSPAPETHKISTHICTHALLTEYGIRGDGFSCTLVYVTVDRFIHIPKAFALTSTGILGKPVSCLGGNLEPRRTPQYAGRRK